MTTTMNAVEQGATIERLRLKLKACYLPLPEHKQILQSIDDLRRYGHRMDGSAQCGQVSGPTDAGKSMLFDEYQKRPDAQASEDATPIIRTIMPSPFVYSDLLDSLIEQFGAQIPSTRMSNSRRLARLVTHARERRTELIMIDEWQHIIDQSDSSAKRPYLAADQIKRDFLDTMRVPVVFNGLPKCDAIYERNTQLKTRRMFTAALRSFDWMDDMERERFSILVASLADEAEFENAENLGEELIERVHLASGGTPGAVHKLVFTAVRIAIRNGLRTLDKSLLAEANSVVAGGGRDWTNVFLIPMSQARNGGKPLDESRVTRLHSKIARPQHKKELA